MALLALVGGCTPGPSPAATGGERLPQTEDVAPSGDDNFFVSPEGRWIVYPSRKGDVLRPVYRRYDLRDRTTVAIGLGEETRRLAAEGRGPLFRAPCWSADGRRLLLGGDGTAFVADLEGPDPAWRAIPADARRAFDAENDCGSPNGRDAAAPARVVRRSSKRVDLLAVDGTRVLARHRANRFLVSRLSIDHLRLSPDGTRLAYAVDEYRGSFATGPQGHVLDVATVPAREPRIIAEPVYGPLRWHPDGSALYACVGDRTRGQSLYVWRFGRP